MTIDNFEKRLDEFSKGMYTGLPVSFFSDRIAWLWKFKKISNAKFIEMLNKFDDGLQYNKYID